MTENDFRSHLGRMVREGRFHGHMTFAVSPSHLDEIKRWHGTQKTTDTVYGEKYRGDLYRSDYGIVGFVADDSMPYGKVYAQ